MRILSTMNWTFFMILSFKGVTQLLGKTTKLHYKRLDIYNDLYAPDGSLWTLFVRNRVRCADKCSADDDCQSFFYKSTSSGNCFGFKFQFSDILFPSALLSNGLQYYHLTSDCSAAGYLFQRTLEMCFKIFFDLKTWHHAEATCASDGGSLISFETEAKHTYITEFFLSYMVGRTGGYWIGLTDIATEGAFVWNEGSAITYSKYAPNNPNNFDAGFTDSRRYNGDCIYMWLNGNWDDNNCDHLRYFICEI